MKTALKITARIFGLVFVLVGALFIVLSLFDSPTYAWRVMTMLYADTQDYKVFPSRPVENGGTVSRIEYVPLPIPNEVEFRYADGLRKEALDELLARTDSRAFLILKR